MILQGGMAPLTEFEGHCIAVTRRLDDSGSKLELSPHGMEYTDEQILALVEFQERFFKPVMVRE
jgi:inorganic pyrophosphatase